jgi:ABC-2 type transport system ATP-binding protein
LLVTLDNPDEQNPEIIRTLVNAGADIQFVGELRHSLEDVYLKLVKNS